MSIFTVYVMGALLTTYLPFVILPEEERIYDPVIYALFGLLWPFTIPCTVLLILFPNL
jgi:hypothetical protein